MASERVIRICSNVDASVHMCSSFDDCEHPSAGSLEPTVSGSSKPDTLLLITAY